MNVLQVINTENREIEYYHIIDEDKLKLCQRIDGSHFQSPSDSVTEFVELCGGERKMDYSQIGTKLESPIDATVLYTFWYDG